jgi:hypothetical protein
MEYPLLSEEMDSYAEMLITISGLSKTALPGFDRNGDG